MEISICFSCFENWEKDNSDETGCRTNLNTASVGVSELLTLNINRKFFVFCSKPTKTVLEILFNKLPLFLFLLPRFLFLQPNTIFFTFYLHSLYSIYQQYHTCFTLQHYKRTFGTTFYFTLVFNLTVIITTHSNFVQMKYRPFFKKLKTFLIYFLKNYLQFYFYLFSLN